MRLRGSFWENEDIKGGHFEYKVSILMGVIVGKGGD